MVPVHLGDERANPVPERAPHWDRLRLGHRHLQAHGPGGRGDLGAEESGTDHDHPGPGSQRGAQGDRVIERARDVDSGQIAVAQAPGSHACGDDQSVEVDALAVV